MPVFWLFPVAPPRAARALALAWTPLVVLAVVATGNHFLFDVGAGLLTTALVFPFTALLTTQEVS